MSGLRKPKQMADKLTAQYKVAINGKQFAVILYNSNDQYKASLVDCNTPEENRGNFTFDQNLNLTSQEYGENPRPDLIGCAQNYIRDIDWANPEN